MPKPLALLLTLLAPAAWATDQYPGVLQDRLSLPSLPRCKVCHANGVTGRGTVTTPFGASLRARGLVADDVASLEAALDALRAEAVDSDGDGVSDVEELLAGTDPNVDATRPTVAPLRYGCGASTVPELLALGLLAPLLRRRPRT